MNSGRISVAVAALCALGAAIPAAAHHSSAMFDQKSSITVSGVVSKVQWVNPHVTVTVEVPGENGSLTRYSLEGSSPNLLGHAGWKANTLKAGDAVTVVFNPLKDGRAGGLLRTVKLPNGVVMKGW